MEVLLVEVTIPGIGKRTAAGMIAYFGAFETFKNPKQVASYLSHSIKIVHNNYNWKTLKKVVGASNTVTEFVNKMVEKGATVAPAQSMNVEDEQGSQEKSAKELHQDAAPNQDEPPIKKQKFVSTEDWGDFHLQSYIKAHPFDWTKPMPRKGQIAKFFHSKDIDEKEYIKVRGMIRRRMNKEFARQIARKVMQEEMDIDEVCESYGGTFWTVKGVSVKKDIKDTVKNFIDGKETLEDVETVSVEKTTVVEIFDEDNMIEMDTTEEANNVEIVENDDAPIQATDKTKRHRQDDLSCTLREKVTDQEIERRVIHNDWDLVEVILRYVIIMYC